jgi:virginiamycin B lyase
VGQAGNYVAYLEPKSGQFKRFEIDSGTHPHSQIVDHTGMVWYSGNTAAMIGKLDPATGKITRYPMPNGDPRDPHTMIEDKTHTYIWFTAQNAGKVGRLTMATGRIEILTPPTPRSRPYGIVLDSKNRPWFNEFGTNKIAMIDPATMAIKEYPLANEQTHDRRIAITSDDKLFYTDYTRGYIGRLDPVTGAVKEWPCPSGVNAMPYAMNADDKDRIWFSETGVQPNKLVAFDAKTEQFVSITPIAKSGGLTIRHMYFHKPTRELWFGTDAGTIGKAKVP